MPVSAFPAGFLWGAATSAYQIEGAARADGKGASIWDRFARRPGRVLHGDTGDRACDTYDPERLRGDLDLMAELGLKAYVFSVQWPRIQPTGRGPPNQKGLDYYRRLVDGLSRRGIVPVPTLYHWELPQALQARGGWLQRDTALRFADYADLVAETLAGQVQLWITQNEPHSSTWLGHVSGKHAPGLRGEQHVAPVAHHLLLSHGLATQRLRRRRGVRVGLVLNVSPYRPASRSPADRAAARRLDVEQNRLFLDPLFLGRYPKDLVRRLGRAGHDFACVRSGDMETIATPLDFLGLNYYAPSRVAAGPDGSPRVEAAVGPKTAMDWAIDPAALGEVLRRLHTDYTGELPLIISENGLSCRDYVDPEGACNDDERIDFLQAHIAQARRAIAEGIPLKGYFVWSLLDNFEWDSGYRERFGLVYVDYATQRRTRKKSFHWYRQVIATNGRRRR
jgi:beta-glucosidase